MAIIEDKSQITDISASVLVFKKEAEVGHINYFIHVNPKNANVLVTCNFRDDFYSIGGHSPFQNH